MTPLEEKIAHEINKMKLLSSWQMTREAEDDIIYALRSIATQAVEEYKKELWDIEFRAPADKSDDWHAGIRYCLEKFRNIISKPNI